MLLHLQNYCFLNGHIIFLPEVRASQKHAVCFDTEAASKLWLLRIALKQTSFSCPCNFFPLRLFLQGLSSESDAPVSLQLVPSFSCTACILDDDIHYMVPRESLDVCWIPKYLEERVQAKHQKNPRSPSLCYGHIVNQSVGWHHLPLKKLG